MFMYAIPYRSLTLVLGSVSYSNTQVGQKANIIKPSIYRELSVLFRGD